jgi:hypothetical protein
MFTPYDDLAIRQRMALVLHQCAGRLAFHYEITQDKGFLSLHIALE